VQARKKNVGLVILNLQSYSTEKKYIKRKSGGRADPCEKFCCRLGGISANKLREGGLLQGNGDKLPSGGKPL